MEKKEGKEGERKNISTMLKTNKQKDQRNKNKETRMHKNANPTLSPPLASRHQKGREDTYDTGGSSS